MGKPAAQLCIGCALSFKLANSQATIDPPYAWAFIVLRWVFGTFVMSLAPVIEQRNVILSVVGKWQPTSNGPFLQPSLDHAQKGFAKKFLDPFHSDPVIKVSVLSFLAPSALFWFQCIPCFLDQSSSGSLQQPAGHLTFLQSSWPNWWLDAPQSSCVHHQCMSNSTRSPWQHSSTCHDRPNSSEWSPKSGVGVCSTLRAKSGGTSNRGCRRWHCALIDVIATTSSRLICAGSHLCTNSAHCLVATCSTNGFF